MESLLIIFLSLLFSGFFSGMEIAFVSANKLRIELDKKQGVGSWRIIRTFSENASQYLATMLIGNNIALVIYGLFMSAILEVPIGKLIESQGVILLIQTIISTAIILVFAEFLPKNLFKISPNKNLKIFAYPTFFFYLLFFPIARFTLFLSNVVLKLIFRVTLPKKSEITFSKSDLDHLVNETNGNPDIKEELDHDVKIFQNALDFSQVKLRECIMPRTELKAVSIDDDVETLRQKFIETGHSKILVYEDSIDNIIGYAHSIKIFEKPSSIKSMIRKIPIVPETMPANKLLALFTLQHKSMALVVDEFGGTAGVVTMEDILEEIIGDIKDEHDKEILIDKQLNETEFQFSGRIEIDHLNEKYNLNIPTSEEYETIAGFILAQKGSIPKINDNITTEGIQFKILKATTTRIELIHLKLI